MYREREGKRGRKRDWVYNKQDKNDIKQKNHPNKKPQKLEQK